MLARSAFVTMHPVLLFAFFIGAIVLTVIIDAPAFQLMSLIGSCALYASLKGRASIKPLLCLLVLFVLVSGLNPVFNEEGATVLFEYLYGRPYTLEALLYGACTASMFVSSLLWFLCFNEAMGSERLMYIFNRVASSSGLVMTMALRFVPEYARKGAEISSARAGLGLSKPQGNLVHKISSGSKDLSALVSWALEGSIITADSMNARGYGCAKRSSYASYPFGHAAMFFSLFFGALFVFVCVCVALGVCGFDYFPVLKMQGRGPLAVCAFSVYALYMLAPAIITWKGVVSWRRSLSRI